MAIEDKHSRKRLEILKAVSDALFDVEYHQLTVEDVASRAGVGKSTIYRWWKHKADLVLDAFKQHTLSIFYLDQKLNLEDNLVSQLLRLSYALDHHLGRALLVVLANHREMAAAFFIQYLLPRRQQMHHLIQQSIQSGEIRADYEFDLMLDSLYGPIHYQIIFFNKMPDEDYIRKLVQMVLLPVRIQG